MTVVPKPDKSRQYLKSNFLIQRFPRMETFILARTNGGEITIEFEMRKLPFRNYSLLDKVLHQIHGRFFDSNTIYSRVAFKFLITAQYICYRENLNKYCIAILNVDKNKIKLKRLKVKFLVPKRGCSS